MQGDSVMVASLTQRLARDKAVFATTTVSTTAPAAGFTADSQRSGGEKKAKEVRSGTADPRMSPADVQTAPDQGTIAGEAPPPAEKSRVDGGQLKTKTIPAHLIKSAGFIAPQLEYDGEIIRNYAGNVGIASDEIVFTSIGASSGAKVGEKYDIFNTDEFVFHPDENAPFAAEVSPPGQILSRYEEFSLLRSKGRPIGYLMRPVGVLEILDVEEKTSKAMIRESYDAILVGDKLVPHVEVKSIPSRPAGAAKNIDAVVVAAQVPADAIGDHEIVYLDKGRNQDVEVGDVFEVYFRPVMEAASFWYGASGSAVMDELPHHVVGNVQIVSVQDNTSTALVLKGSNEIHVGDTLRAKTPVTPQR